MKRPAYQWYPGDADSDEVYKLMTYEQEGIYRRLLDHQWIEGSIPADPHVLASLLPKMPRDRFIEVWPLISAKFRPRGTDRLVNDKLETQRKEREKYLRTQRANVRKRWNRNKLGAASGNTVVLPSNYSSSSTSSSSSSENKSSTAVASADDEMVKRVGDFSERYPQIYAKVRAGAHYRANPVRDYPNFCELVQGWPDDRLDQMLELFLLMPAKDANNIPGTPGQFLNMAPRCDQLLRENGR